MDRTIVNVIKDVPTDEVNDVNNQVDYYNTELDRIERKGLINIVRNLVTASSTFGGTTSKAGVIVTPLNTSIVTKANNSVICYDLTIGFEMHYDTVFFLERVIGASVTEIGSHNASLVGSRTYGFTSPTFDNDVASTLDQKAFKFVDTPNVPEGTTITYRLKFYGSSTHTLFLNRTAANSNATNYELCSSCVILTEYGV